MKSQIVLALTCIIMLGCSKNGNLKDAHEDNNQVIRSLVLKLGFDTTDIVLDQDRVIVEGDILLYKSKLAQTIPRQAAAFDGGPFVTASPDLKYYVPDFFSADFQIFDDAIGEIVSVIHPEKNAYRPTFTSYQRVFEPENADLVFTAFMQNSGLFGYADWPTLLTNRQEFFGSFYPVLKIGSVHFNMLWWRTISPSQRKFLIIHEVGHAVGLRHTDWARSEREFSTETIGAYTVPGTLNDRINPDPLSVFNSGNGTTPFRWNGFTDFDKIALFYVTSGGG